MDVEGYGNCSCGLPLYPVLFREREYETVSGRMVFTGRTRRACSHLECECGRHYAVDDSFDGPWEHDKP